MVLSSPSPSSTQDSSDSEVSSEDEEDEQNFPVQSRLSSPIRNSQCSASISAPRASKIIDLCTPEPEAQRTQSCPLSSRLKVESTSFQSPSLDQILSNSRKRHLSPSVSPTAPRKQEPVRRKYAHKDRDGGICSTCVRCRSKGIRCDKEHPCGRCKWTKSVCVYKKRSTEKCLRCREKGRKCDKEFSCTRCASQGVQCEYADEPPDAKIAMGMQHGKSLFLTPEPGLETQPTIKQEEPHAAQMSSRNVSVTSTADLVPNCEVLPDQKTLRRPERKWIERFTKKTPPPQTATRTVPRTLRRPKLRAKRPICKPKGRRSKMIWAEDMDNTQEKDPYADFEVRPRP